jgi:hypothetical protein
MDQLISKYNYLCQEVSDINEHLPTLFKYASECRSVFETGVRGVTSSYALFYGLTQNNLSDKHMLLNDINECNIHEFLQITKDLDIKTDYIWKNNLDLTLTETFDLVFIDTWHVYGQLKRELEKFSKITNKYIILHDTTVDRIYGETIRLGWNAQNQSSETGIPVEEINCGLLKAVEEFLEQNPNWKLKEEYTNNNGLTILEHLV